MRYTFFVPKNSHIQQIKTENQIEHTQKKDKKYKHKKRPQSRGLSCDPCRIQTCNPHIRSVVLYSVELTDHCFFSKAGAKVLLFFDMTKYFVKKVRKYANFI